MQIKEVKTNARVDEKMQIKDLIFHPLKYSILSDLIKKSIGYKLDRNY